MVGNGRTVQAAAIRPQRVSLSAAWLPQSAVADRRRQAERDQRGRVVVDPALQPLPIKAGSSRLRQADVEVGPIRRHRLHAPVPPVIAAMVLGTLEMPGVRMV